ncbi:MAG: PssE/Cps14G family polysaccharide biosynthesis glycosyltransferase [Bacilli bacterium]|jgi:UDP-N-acetylglucosamine transferase subunit ALG13
MILILLGTQDKPFTRLLDAVQKQIDKGKIKDKIIVQAGCTKYNSKDMEIFDLIPVDEFKNLVKKADLIITHGGVGSIMEGINNGKHIIAAPRLKKYNEHVNDHQIQIIDEFTKLGYILPLKDFNKLDKLILKASKMKPKKFESNTNHMISIIEKYIDSI